MHCPGCGAPLQGDTPCARCASSVTLAPDPAIAPTLPRTLPVTRAAADGVPDTLPVGARPMPKEDPLLGRVVADRFRVLSLLGAGGMGSVYLADQLAVNRHVVLKFLQASLAREEGIKERFAREALAVSRLECPNTIVLHDFGHDEDGRLFIAMEFLEGQTLADLIRAHGALPPLRAIAIALQILASLEEAHQKGIVHRDLKPENIMLVHRSGTRDFVKVLDFGVAKILGEKSGAPSPMDAAAQRADAREQGVELTQQGAIFGSPRYMAPEQAMGETVDARTDLYALGAILHEVLSGKPPFSATNTFKLLHDQAHTPVPPLHETHPQLGLPASLSELVSSCLEKRPDARPSSASALAEALRRVSKDVVRTQEAQEEALLQLVGISRRRRPWLRRVAALLAVAAGGLAAGWAISARQPRLAGVPLAAGERVFLSAARAEPPPWIQRCETAGSRCGSSHGERDRAQALRLAQAAAWARLLPLPLRFAPAERDHHRLDLLRVAESYEKLVPAAEQPRLQTYWVELARGRADGHAERVYDAYVHVPPLEPLEQIAIRRRFSPLRFDNGSFLLDQAVRARKCQRAIRLAQVVRRAIDEMKIKKARRRAMESYLDHQLGPCRERSITPP